MRQSVERISTGAAGHPSQPLPCREGAEARARSLSRSHKGARRQGAVDPNPLKPLQFRFCPPSMAGSQRRTTRRSTKSGNAIMYAVLVTGGKQYRVMKGETLRVELLGEHEPGNEITFDNVLMPGDGDGIQDGAAPKDATLTGKIACHAPAATARTL